MFCRRARPTLLLLRTNLTTLWAHQPLRFFILALHHRVSAPLPNILASCCATLASFCEVWRLLQFAAKLNQDLDPEARQWSLFLLTPIGLVYVSTVLNPVISVRDIFLVAVRHQSCVTKLHVQSTCAIAIVTLRKSLHLPSNANTSPLT